MVKNLYLCYEVNHNISAIGINEIEEESIFATSSVYLALRHFQKRLTLAINDGFILSKEQETISISDIERLLQKGESISFTFFYKHRNNTDCCFDVNIKVVKA